MSLLTLCIAAFCSQDLVVAVFRLIAERVLRDLESESFVPAMKLASVLSSRAALQSLIEFLADNFDKPGHEEAMWIVHGKDRERDGVLEQTKDDEQDVSLTFVNYFSGTDDEGEIDCD